MTRGIYRIFNHSTLECYIGSSNDIEYRFILHLDDLRKDKHVNRHLQNSFNKHGEQSFSLEIVEIVPETTDLLSREQYYLPQGQYNIARSAWHPSRKGMKNSEEHKRKISQGNKGKKRSLEAIEKNRQYHLGRRHSKETRLKMSESQRKRRSNKAKENRD